MRVLSRNTPRKHCFTLFLKLIADNVAKNNFVRAHPSWINSVALEVC